MNFLKTKEMNKEKVEQLISELASKELTFGCEVEYKHMSCIVLDYDEIELC